MNCFIGIALAVMVLFVLVIMLSACKAASIADQQMEYELAKWLEDHPEEKDKLMHQHEALY